MNTNILNISKDIAIKTEDDTRKVFAEIIDSAKKRAVELVESVKNFKQEGEAVMDKSFEEIKIAQMDEYKQKLHTISNDIQNRSIKEMQDLALMASDLVKRMESMFESRLGEELKDVDQDVQEYKKKRLEMIDAKLPEYISEVTRSLIGESISVDLQQKHVISMLDELKAAHGLHTG